MPTQSPTRVNMVKIYSRTVAAAMLLILRSAGVLANHKPGRVVFIRRFGACSLLSSLEDRNS